MGLLFGCALWDVLFLLTAASISIYYYFQWAYQYWKRKGVPYLQPRFPFGNLPNMIRPSISFADNLRNQYEEAKAKGYKHMGLFSFFSPFYVPIDPDYIRNIMAKDFDHFVDRGIYYNEKDDPLSATMFTIEGAKWRNLRMKLTPTFTSGKMKLMFNTLAECSKQLDGYVGQMSSKSEPLDIRDISGCFTTDVIASCAFGIECNSFKDMDSDFRKYLKKSLAMTPLQLFIILITFIVPNFARSLGIRFLAKDVSDYFRGVVHETIEYREKNKVVRNDFLHLLLEMKNNILDNGGEYKHDGKSLTEDELAAQVFLFLNAGYETSSITMTFCLYELAVNQDIQEKVREEITSVLDKHDGKLTYDAIMEMEYLTQAVKETLRKYPPLEVLNRVCVADYKFPDVDVTLEKGTLVNIPIAALQKDEDYFPDPERFDPDRFSEENKHRIPHFTYMPFGEGPRACIGLRFGMMQVKVGLAVLLKNYLFAVNNKTPTTLKSNPTSFVFNIVGKIWLDAKKIN